MNFTLTREDLRALEREICHELLISDDWAETEEEAYKRAEIYEQLAKKARLKAQRISQLRIPVWHYLTVGFLGSLLFIRLIKKIY